MFFQSFSANTTGRDFVVGDIHGMYDLLINELRSVDFEPHNDRCFSCGDLIDRGPQPEECLSLIHQPWFHPVRGNHEDCLIQMTRSPSSAVMADWLMNGGRWHLLVSSERMHRYADELEQLPLLIEVERPDGQRIAICHGEYPLSRWAPETIESDPDLTHALQWSRSKIQSGDDSIVTGIDHIVCGHTIVDHPTTLGNTHFIDTGAFTSGQLTLIPLAEL